MYHVGEIVRIVLEAIGIYIPDKQKQKDMRIEVKYTLERNSHKKIDKVCKETHKFYNRHR